MSIRTIATVISTVAGLGGTAAGGAVYLGQQAATPAVQPAAAQVSSSAGSAGATATSGAPTSSTAPRCDDGAWTGPGSIDPNGRPRFDAGDSGAVYIWHDGTGWHLRSTDALPGAHHYTGTVALNADARFTSFRSVRLERDDHVWVTGDNVLHYDFTTYRGVDGLDFTVSACGAARDHETLHFSLDYNGREQDTARIRIGENRAHPDAATFAIRRDV